MARRVGDNEWYIDNGGWGFNILSDTTVGIAGLPVNANNTLNMHVYIFEADDETIAMFDGFGNVAAFKSKCPQLKLEDLPPYVAPVYDADDDIAF